MGKIIVENTGDEIEVAQGDRIQAACEEAGVPFACTEGVCGTCVIEVKSGMDHLSEYNQAEEDFLGPKGCERLACQCRLLKGDLRIKF